MEEISNLIPLLISLPVILIGIFLFTFLFNFILSFKIKKIFPERFSKLKKNFEKPIKKIGLILIRFGNESVYGDSEPHSIPAKLYIYNDMVIAECAGWAAVINDYKLLSIKENKTYEIIMNKQIEHVREDLMIYVPKKYNLQFIFSSKKDLIFIKKYLEERNNV